MTWHPARGRRIGPLRLVLLCLAAGLAIAAGPVFAPAGAQESWPPPRPTQSLPLPLLSEFERIWLKTQRRVAPINRALVHRKARRPQPRAPRPPPPHLRLGR